MQHFQIRSKNPQYKYLFLGLLARVEPRPSGSLDRVRVWVSVAVLVIASTGNYSAAQERHLISNREDVERHSSHTLSGFPKEGISWTCYSRGRGATPSRQNIASGEGGWSDVRLYLGVATHPQPKVLLRWGILEFGNVTPSRVRIVWDFENDETTRRVWEWLYDNDKDGIIAIGKAGFEASPFLNRIKIDRYADAAFFKDLNEFGMAVSLDSASVCNVGFVAMDDGKGFAVAWMKRGTPVDGVYCSSPITPPFRADMLEMRRYDIAREEQWRGILSSVPREEKEVFAIGARGYVVKKDRRFVVSFCGENALDTFETSGCTSDAASKFASFWRVDTLSEANRNDLVALSVFSSDTWRFWNQADYVRPERKLGTDLSQPIPIDPALWAIPRDSPRANNSLP